MNIINVYKYSTIKLLPHPLSYDKLSSCANKLTPAEYVTGTYPTLGQAHASLTHVLKKGWKDWLTSRVSDSKNFINYDDIVGVGYIDDTDTYRQFYLILNTVLEEKNETVT